MLVVHLCLYRDTKGFLKIQEKNILLILKFKIQSFTQISNRLNKYNKESRFKFMYGEIIQLLWIQLTRFHHWCCLYSSWMIPEHRVRSYPWAILGVTQWTPPNKLVFKLDIFLMLISCSGDLLMLFCTC